LPAYRVKLIQTHSNSSAKSALSLRRQWISPNAFEPIRCYVAAESVVSSKVFVSAESFSHRMLK
jgi:hypothetical protein